jgi:hypothetical protein
MSVVADSGASTDTFNNLRWFIDIKRLDNPETYVGSNGQDCTTYWAGTATFNAITTEGTITKMTFHNALFSPDAPCSMISTFKLRKSGAVIDGFSDTLVLKESRRQLAKIDWVGKVATFRLQSPSHSISKDVKHAMLGLSYQVMHQRLMHANKDVIMRACQQAGIHISKTNTEDTHCEDCAIFKATNQVSRDAPSGRTLTCFQKVRIDVISHDVGHLGFKYTIHFIDEHTGYHWLKFAKTKDEVFEKIKEWVIQMETQTGLPVQSFGADNGSDLGLPTKLFEDSKLKKFCKSKGIILRLTTFHTPNQNGRAERAGRAILNMSRTSLKAANLPDHLWPFSEETTVTVLNLLPSKANPHMKSPHQMLAEALKLHDNVHFPYILHIRTFGCISYVWIHEKYRRQGDKLAPRAWKGQLIGYDGLHGKIFWIWIPEQGKIVRASAVRFHEHVQADKSDDNAPEYEAIFEDPSPDEIEQLEDPLSPAISVRKRLEARGILSLDDLPSMPEIPSNITTKGHPLPTPQQTPAKPKTTATSLPESNEDSLEDSPEPTPGETEDSFQSAEEEEEEEIRQENPIPPDNPSAPPDNNDHLTQRRTLRTKDRIDYKTLGSTGEKRERAHLQISPIPEPERQFTLTPLKSQILATISINLPRNYKQALRQPDFNVKWLPAMKTQYNYLQQRKVWILEDLPPGTQVIPGKWVYDEKTNQSTGEVIARARWVACGNYEDDQNWAIQDTYAAVATSTSIRTMIVITAILNHDLQQFDFCTAFLNADVPDGKIIYVIQPSGFEDGTGRACRLLKALYGLRESPLWWFKCLVPVMKKLGFIPFNSDLCLFKHDKLGVLVILHVDDMLVSGPTSADIRQAIDLMKAQFEIKELGEARRFLGFEITRDRTKQLIYLSQTQFTEKIIAKYGYGDHKPSSTPWPRNFELPLAWKPDTSKTKWYIKRTGSVNYLSTGTRPDITYTTNRLCEANAGPSEAHVTLMTHLFRYLIQTTNFALKYGGKLPLNNLGLLGYADAAFADDVKTRHSTGGHVIFLADGPVFWKTKKQSVVALSTTEAEFMNLTPAGLSLKWINNILTEMGYKQDTPLLLYTDSANARATVLNADNTARTRHVDIRYKWIIERTVAKDFRLEHVSTGNMVADGLTKALSKEKHSKFVKLLGLIEIA